MLSALRLAHGLAREVGRFARAHHVAERELRGEGILWIEHAVLDFQRERLARRIVAALNGQSESGEGLLAHVTLGAIERGAFDRGGRVIGNGRKLELVNERRPPLNIVADVAVPAGARRRPITRLK